MQEDPIKLTAIDSALATSNYNFNTNANESISRKISLEDNGVNIVSYSVNANPMHGTVKLNEDGTWTYKPNADYIGTDSFSIKTTYKNGQVAYSTINVNIKDIQNAKKAEDILPQTGGLLDSKVLNTIGGALIGIG